MKITTGLSGACWHRIEHSGYFCTTISLIHGLICTTIICPLNLHIVLLFTWPLIEARQEKLRYVTRHLGLLIRVRTCGMGRLTHMNAWLNDIKIQCDATWPISIRQHIQARNPIESHLLSPCHFCPRSLGQYLRMRRPRLVAKWHRFTTHSNSFEARAC